MGRNKGRRDGREGGNCPFSHSGFSVFPQPGKHINPGVFFFFFYARKQRDSARLQEGKGDKKFWENSTEGKSEIQKSLGLHFQEDPCGNQGRAHTDPGETADKWRYKRSQGQQRSPPPTGPEGKRHSQQKESAQAGLPGAALQTDKETESRKEPISPRKLSWGPTFTFLWKASASISMNHCWIIQ